MIYLELFYTFFLIGLFTIGGGAAMLPLIQQMVLEKGWLSEEMLINVIGISESTPGPIAVNVATYIGSSQGGFLGALLATLGVVLPSFIIILIIVKYVKKFLEYKSVEGVFKGIKPVVIGLIISVGLYFVLKVSVTQIVWSDFSAYLDFRAIYIMFSLLVFNLISKGIKGKILPPILQICLSAALGMLVYSI